MNRCEGCKLCNLGTTYRICIPPPSDKIRGCIISRDPSSAFLKTLDKFRQLPADQKGNLWFNAPPRWLYNKISNFMNYPESSWDMDKLQHFLDKQCYWTHLHKCPTKPRENQDQDQKGMSGMKEYFPPFQYATGKSCADTWFEYEFNEYGLKDKIIITLGRDVEKFFGPWAKYHNLENSENIIRLPHPSGRNRLWNKNSKQKESIIKEIDRLLQLI